MVKPRAKIGIYSGTFDPIHQGHIDFALEAAQQCDLKKIYFLVEPRPRRKQGVKALEHRQAMVKLAIAHEPKLGSIVLDHARYSVRRTLPILQARFVGSEIVFLMGDDMLHYFTDSDWPQLEDFIQAVKVVIGVRQRQSNEIEQHIKAIQKTLGIKLDYEMFETSQSRQASSKVREKLRKGERPDAIPIQVIRYINQHQLYSPGSVD